MHDDLRQLQLTFPSIPVSARETPQNLLRLLFKGGASLWVNKVDQAIQDGLLGDIQPDRVEFVIRIHATISDSLAGGGSAQTARRQIESIVSFFNWADKSNASMLLSEVTKTYLDWSEHLMHRIKVIKDMKQSSAYNLVRLVGQILDGTLDRPTPIVEATRIQRPKQRKTSQGANTDKQNLANTFAFGRLLQDICDATPLSVIKGAELVRIPLQQGGEIEFSRGLLEYWLRPGKQRLAANLRKSNEAAISYASDQSLGHPFRQAMVNLRIQAELLMFIGQTGMNLKEAQMLQLRNFSYSSDIDGYKVREYKKRRGGEVLFEIFSEYRNHFDRYLDWRRALFPMAVLMFPIIRSNGTRPDRRPSFHTIRKACDKSGVPWTSPRMLRGTRVNWLLRRSSDADLTAAMAQHSKEMLLTIYQVPSQQRAMGEIIRFHQRNDPTLNSNTPLIAVAPGQCDGIPVALPAKPESATNPDCRRPSGCLWCEHHRDIDSLDYVWSLASFRHLKILELGGQGPAAGSKITHPAEHAIQKLSEKLTWFRKSNVIRSKWVDEALTLVEEGSYQDHWSYLIEAMEGSSR